MGQQALYFGVFHWYSCSFPSVLYFLVSLFPLVRDSYKWRLSARAVLTHPPCTGSGEAPRRTASAV
ncbi:hypothetical protein GY45DRAFT_1323056 [Cubamyces sp. BRFM 1775]|nr:hypothetical protein GY45DRAFT_1323056 [Cubamyces sp. BRFM 1775]